MRAFVAGKGSVEVLGSKVNGERGEHRWNHLTFTLPLYLCDLLLPFHPWSTPHWNSSWLPWLPGYLIMIAWNALTQNLWLWPPCIYLLRTIRSHTLHSDWSARYSPSQWWLWSLRHHNVTLCQSTWVSGCWQILSLFGKLSPYSKTSRGKKNRTELIKMFYRVKKKEHLLEDLD